MAASRATGSDVKTDSGFDIWINNLYDTNVYSDDEVKNLYEVYQYQGFSRSEVLKAFFKLITDVKIAIQIIIVCALRGPQRAAVTKLTSGRTIESYGIPASGLKGGKGLSCNRVTAATADLAAYYLKKMDVPKRINVICPGWLQFPSAGSIKLPEDLRQQHIDFTTKFSPMIGGTYNDSIYQQMVSNSYLNERLNLFGRVESIAVSSTPSSTDKPKRTP